MNEAMGWFPALLGAAATMIAPAAEAGQPGAWRFHYDHVLGTSLDLVAVADDPGVAALAAAAACAEIARLDPVLSAWRADGELACLNRDGRAVASPDLYTVLDACERWRAATGGAFDARVGGTLDRLRAGRPAAPLPGGAAGVALDPATRGVVLAAGTRLAVDGLAKGHVIDRALVSARTAVPGLRGMMVDIGGDLGCWGRAPTDAGWRIGVAAPGAPDRAAPAEMLVLTDGAVATSGRGQRDLRDGDRARSHVIDPRTGLPAGGVAGATVVAASALDADAASTALAALVPDDAAELAARLPGVEARITASDGRILTTPGWRGMALARPGLPLVRVAADGAAAWPSGHVLDVAYEIPKVESDNYRAPYVAIWVTDTDRKLVRTLLMLGDEARWLDSNYLWWRRYGRKMETPQLEGMTKPTRLPGRYELAWDGLDDAGAPVGTGTFLVHIEASREHGGHSYASTEVKLDGGALDVVIPAAEEIGETRLRFGAPR